MRMCCVYSTYFCRASCRADKRTVSLSTAELQRVHVQAQVKSQVNQDKSQACIRKSSTQILQMEYSLVIQFTNYTGEHGNYQLWKQTADIYMTDTNHRWNCHIWISCRPRRPHKPGEIKPPTPSAILPLPNEGFVNYKVWIETMELHNIYHQAIWFHSSHITVRQSTGSIF